MASFIELLPFVKIVRPLCVRSLRPQSPDEVIRSPDITEGQKFVRCFHEISHNYIKTAATTILLK